MGRISHEYGIKTENQKYPKSGFLRVRDYDLPEGCARVLVYATLLTDEEVKKYGLVDLNPPAKNLTKMRVKVGMKQTELARVSGVPLRTIQGWELNGMAGAALSKAYKIAKALGCQIEDLLDEEDR